METRGSVFGLCEDDYNFAGEYSEQDAFGIWVIPYESTEKNMTIFFWIFDPKSQKFLIF